MLSRIAKQEYQYLNLVKNVIEHGDLKRGRNGNTYSLFGAQMRFDLRNNTLPLLTTKRVAWKTCLRELLWFINGDTSNTELRKQSVNIWNKNGTREFLDSRGLYNNAVDDLGPVYGHQWRHFNAKYNTSNDDYTGKGVDQLKYIIDVLSGKHETEDKHSRRLII